MRNPHHGDTLISMTDSKKHFVLVALALIAALLFAALLVVHYRKTHVYDGFEAAELGSRWSKHRMVPESFRTQSEDRKSVV